MPAETTSTMTLRILFFSVLRERIGKEELAVTLPEGATGSVLLDALENSHSEIATFRPVIRLAVNEAYAASDTLLHNGDEVALITPVSGG